MWKEAHFRFLAELNDFLLPERRDRVFAYRFTGSQSVKHLVEALGVPHTEVGFIMVNGQLADFRYQVRDGDRVEVHPHPSPTGNAKTDPDPRSEQATPRFLLDNHLGRLAAYLRMLGFDAAYRNDFQDEDLVRIAVQEGRVLLTRDRRLLMRRAVARGCLVRSPDPRAQVLEVVRRFDLFGRINPFRRCLRCNHLLQPVGKEEILERLEPLTRRYYDEFHRCPACGQIYWKGSHYERMQRLVESFRNENEQ